MPPAPVTPTPVTPPPVTIVDYGLGNIRSLLKMFAKLRVPTRLAGTAAELAEAERLLLPGVGHFGAAMAELRQRDLISPLNDLVQGRGVPVLGICLGMQLLARGSEEGGVEGLGWIAADVVRFRFPAETRRPVPNMGWRHVTPTGVNGLLPPGQPWRFYFVHSYHMACDRPEDVLATADYGGPFTAAVAKGSIAGAQFHPEKSHRYGMAMLGAFAKP